MYRGRLAYRPRSETANKIREVNIMKEGIHPNYYLSLIHISDGMEGSVFYEPSDNGYEREIKRHMRWLKEDSE